MSVSKVQLLYTQADDHAFILYTLTRKIHKHTHPQWDILYMLTHKTKESRKKKN